MGWRSLVGGYAWLVVRARLLVLLAAAAGTWAAVTLLPGLSVAESNLATVVGTTNPAVQAQEAAVRQFGFPLVTRTSAVQRDPGGLDPAALGRSASYALATDQAFATRGGPLFAVPVPNLVQVPAVGPRATTIVTYLFTDPLAPLPVQDAVARQYAAGLRDPRDALVGVAGTIPVQVEQANLVNQWLPWVEIGAVVGIALIVGLNFGSVVAPLITLLAAGVGYLITEHVLGEFEMLVNLALPGQLEPVVVALLLGITTDYSIFFMSGVRWHLAGGTPGPRATIAAVREYLPIVFVAGITVGVSVAVLVVAQSGLFRAFGPGLAVTVGVGLAVSITIVPALLALLGRWVFWPGRPAVPPGPWRGPRGRGREARGRLVRALARRWVAAPVTAIVLTFLVVVALPLAHMRWSVSPAAALPEGNSVRQAADAAAAGFAPGVLSPTEVIVSAPQVAQRNTALAAMQQELGTRPGVATVFGPVQQPLPLVQRAFRAPDGNAVRFLVVLGREPTGSQAITDLRAIRNDMPHMLAAAGLPGARVDYAGDTALALYLDETVRGDLVRITIAVAVLDLLLLVVFLRALVAPVYLLMCNMVTVGAALGLTTWYFQDVQAAEGLIFYVPLSVAVLLVAFGSDYNIFLVGYVAEQARERPLREALVHAVPRTTRSISIAGLALAVSFAFLALIPVAPFRQVAFAMGVGVVIDAFIVRTLLVPSLLALVGPASGWPSRRFRPAQHAPDRR